jgi:hypothetical protein
LIGSLGEIMLFSMRVDEKCLMMKEESLKMKILKRIRSDEIR